MITHTVKKRSQHPRDVSLKSWAKEGLCGNKDVGVILKETSKTLSVKSQILEEYII